MVKSALRDKLGLVQPRRIVVALPRRLDKTILNLSVRFSFDNGRRCEEES